MEASGRLPVRLQILNPYKCGHAPCWHHATPKSPPAARRSAAPLFSAPGRVFGNPAPKIHSLGQPLGQNGLLGQFYTITTAVNDQENKGNRPPHCASHAGGHRFESCRAHHSSCCNSSDLAPSIILAPAKNTKTYQNRIKTRSTRRPPYQNCFDEPASPAWRLSVVRASRFICSFICEYFLKTLASVCRSSCVTHSSATPPALSRVA